MTVRLRPAMATLPTYIAGRKSPGAVVLASNESPYGLLPAVAATIDGLTAGVSRYPDMTSAALLETIAAYHGVAAEQVAVGAGSVEVVGQLAAAVVDSGDEVIFGWRAFEAYPIITTVVGGTAVKVPLRDEIHDLEAMIAAITPRTRLVLVCNPNNPTGTAVGDELTRFVDRVPDDVLVVIDEAYHHYADSALVPDATVAFRDRPNVVVTRTFSKAFALAGLRVGYCIGASDVVAAVRKTQVPFSVSGLAQQCAIAALGDEEEVRRRAAETVTERERVAAALRSTGYEIPLSQANFVWLPIGDEAMRFAEHCSADNVLVRPFAGEGVRVTIGLPEENDRFLTLAESWTPTSRRS
ncbi:MAG TPA: histidinol-phosphate transaminase [Mycobacteriales bacterium]|nr:histidinol-phosphate transaminase [Mycobacteriales bacterium]HVX70953.1 histidinol-phosphate transaminase [Mycobacteriales bacterium]